MIEFKLAEKFHWTPEQIAKVPYKWIQMYFIFDNAQGAASEIRAKLAESNKNQPKSGSKTFYREV